MTCPSCRPWVERGEDVRCTVCGQGAHVAQQGARAATPPPSPVPTPALLRDLLGALLHDLALSLWWDARAGLPSGTGPRGYECPIGRWQGLFAGGVDTDATEVQVQSLWRLVVSSPKSRNGRAVKAGFLASLVRYCEEGAPRPCVDVAEARAASERLHALVARRGAVGQVLLVLRRRCTERSTWPEACSAVAEELAPPLLRQAWELGRAGLATGAPPVEAQRIAWGEEWLAEAVREWAERA